MPDKVNRFNTDCSAVITAATCQILWKFVNNFYGYNKNLWLTSCEHSVQGQGLHLHPQRTWRSNISVTLQTTGHTSTQLRRDNKHNVELQFKTQW